MCAEQVSTDFWCCYWYEMIVLDGLKSQYQTVSAKFSEPMKRHCWVCCDSGRSSKVSGIKDFHKKTVHDLWAPLKQNVDTMLEKLLTESSFWIRRPSSAPSSWVCWQTRCLHLERQPSLGRSLSVAEFSCLAALSPEPCVLDPIRCVPTTPAAIAFAPVILSPARVVSRAERVDSQRDQKTSWMPDFFQRCSDLTTSQSISDVVFKLESLA